MLPCKTKVSRLLTQFLKQFTILFTTTDTTSKLHKNLVQTSTDHIKIKYLSKKHSQISNIGLRWHTKPNKYRIFSFLIRSIHNTNKNLEFHNYQDIYWNLRIVSYNIKQNQIFKLFTKPWTTASNLFHLFSNDPFRSYMPQKIKMKEKHLYAVARLHSPHWNRLKTM